ncbi:phosphoribosyl-AMP cyclohydrolase [Algicella marina]|uniref:Phosphoribosyl-AMP cyclohydrolase n=1 Tax=Algicella marina TaxID=2683284 RepID=A0A6P1SYR9_9RHOB|nr:phosphoribosyl-AMP cyclohydrolase [Algicella marina]QHQ34513.1 phosphoribosyl-AMP cyclohydrolase [Algicella marina]
MAKFDPETLRWTQDGLVPAIAQDAEGGQVLMMAWMNRESLDATLATGNVTYWSRSRQELWRKGATSGHVQKLVSLAIDCDRDCILMQVTQVGAACHTGRRHCFYTEIRDGQEVVTEDPL